MIDAKTPQNGLYSSEMIRLMLRSARQAGERSRLASFFRQLPPDASVHAKVRLGIADLLEGFNAPESAAQWRDAA